MAFTQQDVVNKAVILGGLDSQDVSLMERLDVTAEMVIAKTDGYLGYDCSKVDALCSILAEISVTQIKHYKSLDSKETNGSGVTKRIVRGDYSVEYETSPQTASDVWNQYEWLLKKYKKLVSL